MTIPPDTPHTQGQRRQLVAEVRAKGIQDPLVLEAIGKVMRHAFIDPGLIAQAYKDIALRIGQEQTISQPYTVAYQTQLLRPQPGMRVLEIGTGSGYQAAVLAECGCSVYTIERHRDLHRLAQARLVALGYSVRQKCADGTRGWGTYAPYEGILVTAASPGIPRPLLEQLAVGGRLVIPVGGREEQKMAVITRLDEERFDQQTLEAFKFVPLIGEEGWRA
jgi:protein-L-isoaspartate(D-aspartate) O-methyltransferase